VALERALWLGKWFVDIYKEPRVYNLASKGLSSFYGIEEI
jgi:hypothetical protein